jgi:hypothetical protein
MSKKDTMKHTNPPDVEKHIPMRWFKERADAFMIMGTLAAAMLWMHAQLSDINERMGKIDNRLTVIETVLMMKDIMPKDLPKCAAVVAADQQDGNG